MARRATLVAQTREAQLHVLLLDGGDTLLSDQYQPLTQASKGALVIEGMNLMGYDAMVLGERDLQLDVEILRQRMSEASFPILSANVRLAESEELFALPYAVLEPGGRSVGIIGLTGMAAEPAPAFTISDPIAAAKEVLPEVAGQSDLVIILSHLGWTGNVQLADLSADVDLIIGGGMQAPGKQPYQAPSTGTRLAQAELPTSRHAGRYVGRWKLNLNTEGQLTVHGWKTIPLGPEFTDDPAVVALLQRYHGQ